MWVSSKGIGGEAAAVSIVTKLKENSYGFLSSE